MAAIAKKKKTAAGTKKKATSVAKRKSKTVSSSAKKGSKLQCRVCGMSVTVDEICGCVEAHDIMCCGTAMKPKKK